MYTTEIPRLILPAVASFVFAIEATAQGDNCSLASTIALGTTSFDTTQAGVSGFDGGGVCGVTSPDMGKDVFFQFTAPASDDYVIDTFGSSFDTQLAVHAGAGCVATCVEYSDDVPGIAQSQVFILGANAGDQFLVQVGGYLSAAGPGVLNLAVYNNPCDSLLPDVYEDNDNCSSAVPLTTGSYFGLNVLNGDSDYYLFTIPSGEELSVSETFDSNDAQWSLWNGSCTTQLESGPSGFSHLNTSGSPGAVVIKVENWIGAGVECSTYDFEIKLEPIPCFNTSDDAFENNDDCSMPANLTAGSYVGLHASIGDDDYYSVIVPPGMHLIWTETADSNDVAYDLWSSSCGSQLLVDQSSGFEWHNGSGVAQTVYVKAYNRPHAPLSCTDYDVTLAIVSDPCQAISDDVFEDNDFCMEATPLGDGTYLGLFAYVFDRDHYSFCVAPGETVTVSLNGVGSLPGDVDAYLWDAQDLNCGAGAQMGALVEANSFGGAFFTWTNGASSTFKVVLEVDVKFGPTGNCGYYDLTLMGTSSCGGPTGIPFCSPMDVNSTGNSTTIAGFSGTGAGSGLRLSASAGPPGEFGYFMIGSGFSVTGIPISNGRLCLDPFNGNFIGRYNLAGGERNSLGQFDAVGELQNMSGTSAIGSGFDIPTLLPAAGNPSIFPGQTWYFQLWHRDTPAGMGQSNYSNGMALTF